MAVASCRALPAAVCALHRVKGPAAIGRGAPGAENARVGLMRNMSGSEMMWPEVAVGVGKDRHGTVAGTPHIPTQPPD
eukprot:scaffold9889_cov109-Isochrysis_galbana.AAC.4